MKNLMLHINPRKSFIGQDIAMVKVQIDNSIELGWKQKDILLVTNFDYEYNGIKAMVVDDSLYCEVHNKASKINVIIYLIKKGIIGNDLWWFHDFDAFQIHPITEEELGLGDIKVGFTDYGWQPRWNTGSIFFKKESLRIFEWIRNVVYKQSVGRSDWNEEKALGILTKQNFKNINSEIKRLNVRYNFPGCLNGVRHLEIDYNLAEKIVKVLHFHIFYGRVNYLHKMCGENDLNLCLIPDKLLNIFKKHMPEFCPGYENN